MTFIISLVSFVLLLIFLLLLLVIFKPPFAWEPLKVFLNADQKINTYEISVDKNALYSKINSEGLAHKKVTLTETEVSYLLTATNPSKGNIYANITGQKLIIAANIDAVDKPLWLRAILEQQQQTYLITKVGFGRFDMPQFMAEWLQGGMAQVLAFIDISKPGTSIVNFFNQMIDQAMLDDRLELKDVTLAEKSVTFFFK